MKRSKWEGKEVWNKTIEINSVLVSWTQVTLFIDNIDTLDCSWMFIGKWRRNKKNRISAVCNVRCMS